MPQMLKAQPAGVSSVGKRALMVALSSPSSPVCVAALTTISRMYVPAFASRSLSGGQPVGLSICDVL